MEIQINVAVRISCSQATVLMNSKSEFHQAPIVRVVVTSGLHSSQGEEPDYVTIRRKRGGREQGGVCSQYFYLSLMRAYFSHF